MPSSLPPAQPWKQPPQAHHVYVLGLVDWRALPKYADLHTLADSGTWWCSQPLCLASRISWFVRLNEPGRYPTTQHHVGNSFHGHVSAPADDSAQARLNDACSGFDWCFWLSQHRFPDHVPRLPHAPA